MQQLQFEASWEKTLAPQDLEYIKGIFQETKDLKSSEILFSPIREALNHKEDLLVTVLVHNFSDQPLKFTNTRLLYKIQGDIKAEKAFTLPALVIPSKVSMPWTFIFPKDNYTPSFSFENGQLEIL
ncbi:SLAP domain-containing protein [Ureibacillus composti]